MIGWIVLVIVLALAGYFFGRSRGRKLAQDQAEPTAQRLREAWQEGYEAANDYLRRTGQLTHAPPGELAPVPLQESSGPGTSGILTPLPVQPQGTGVPQQVSPAPRAEVQAKPVKVLTKRERELRNINITLYVAALMIVAAGALFLSFALPPVAKLIAFFLLAVAFYLGGLITYAVKPSLRPAGAAFAGTGLALLPLCAIATYNTLNISGPSTWLIFSVIGTVAVGYATVKLKSRVLSWVAVLILVSTGMASAAAMQRGVLNYMLVLLLLSVVLMLLAVRSKKIQDSIFFQAILGTAQLLPAFVVVLSLILFESLRSRDYFWIFALLTAQLLLTLRLLSNLRLLRFFAARLTFLLMVLAACNYLALSNTTTALIFAFIFGLQAVAVMLYSEGYRKRMPLTRGHLQLERSVLWGLALVSVVIACFFANETTSTVLRLLVLPTFALLCLPGLLRVAKAEMAVIAALPLVVLVGREQHGWQPLALFLMAIIGLSLAHHRTEGLTRQICGHIRWVLLLITAGMLGGAIHESFPALSTGSELGARLITVLLVLQFLWVIALLNSSTANDGVKRIHTLWRIAASVVIALGIVGYLQFSVIAARGTYDRLGYLTLNSLPWFVITLSITTLLMILSGWRLHSPEHQSGRTAQSVKVVEASALLVLYALSFEKDAWVLALVIGTGTLAHFLVHVRRSNDQSWKIIYASLAQVLFSSMMWWFARSMDFDIHGRFALLVVSLSIPQLTRLLINIRHHKPLRQELRWVAIGLLIGIPVAVLGYGWLAGGADRGVILLAAVCVGTHGCAAFIAERTGLSHRAQYYLFAPIVAIIVVITVQASVMSDQSGWLRSRWWNEQVAAVLLLVMALLAIAAEWRWRSQRHISSAIALAIFLPALVVGWWQIDTWWAVAANTVLAVALTLLVITRKSAWYALGSVIMLTVTIVQAVIKIRGVGSLRVLDSMDISWALIATGAVLYLLAMAHGRMKEPAPDYPPASYRHADPLGAASRIYFADMLLALLIAGGLAHLDGVASWSIIGGAVLIFGVGVLVCFFELPDGAKAYMVDGLIVLGAVLALSSYSWIRGTPEFSGIMAYLSLVAVVLVIWRTFKAHPALERAYLIAGSIAASMTLFAALAESNTIAQIIGLLFFGCLIAWGLKLGQRLFIWWGAIALTLSVMWFLRELVFLWLVLIGLGLIIAAVYKLVKVDRAGPSTAQPPVDQSTANLPSAPRLPWGQPAQHPAQGPDSAEDSGAQDPEQR
ncbi:hypothetical protein QMQ05_11645 [Glutamicibacter ectropisis]|uniref:DUF2339 domain-containing protein n=1 Tax=Glutamicibacter ectropisis TaxID=3046593 RepID=A0AAU6WBT6_9MICC